MSVVAGTWAAKQLHMSSSKLYSLARGNYLALTTEDIHALQQRPEPTTIPPHGLRVTLPCPGTDLTLDTTAYEEDGSWRPAKGWLPVMDPTHVDYQPHGRELLRLAASGWWAAREQPEYLVAVLTGGFVVATFGVEAVVERQAFGNRARFELSEDPPQARHFTGRRLLIPGRGPTARPLEPRP